MTLGTLEFLKAVEHPEMVAGKVSEALGKVSGADGVGVSEIDPSLSDTAAFCEKYQIGPEVAANCVILRAKKSGAGSEGNSETTGGEVQVQYVACVILATTRVDVNGLMREVLGTKKISFAPMDEAVSLSEMEFGGITPVGLPASWPIYIDKAVAESPQLIIGSGVRKSKLLVSGTFLSTLPNAQILEGLGQVKQI
ncbi:MAG TPA: YbaK/EbsC family protein [Candidatus Paceibacterota bacterium]|nr:YbaK/EbsC family protein [Candidatus Paceibacterota bacterium]